MITNIMVDNRDTPRTRERPAEMARGIGRPRRQSRRE